MRGGLIRRRALNRTIERYRTLSCLRNFSKFLASFQRNIFFKSGSTECARKVAIIAYDDSVTRQHKERIS